jgi:transcription elongation factor GreA
VRAPHVLVTLARLAEAGKLPGDYPPPTQRAQSLLTLATHLWQERRVDAATGRVHTRLVEFLAGKEPMLEQLLDGADPRTLRSVQLLIQRGVEESIDNIVTSLVFHAGPVEGSEGPPAFWADEDKIYTTRSGLDRTRRELKELYEVKMPENEAAIGRAAAMGDLSENAEWDAAMEEKRNLSDRAGRMESEIRRATLLENESLPDDMVCPGTVVRYRDMTTQETHTITILGPWDTEGRDDVVSYKAPLARGLLGLHVRDQRTVQLPAGSIEVEVLTIAPAAID